MRRHIDDTLALLDPEDLFLVWSYVDSLEQAALLKPAEAERWKQAIFQRMDSCELEPDDVLANGMLELPTIGEVE